ncbi:hypothetical protein B0H16DRAFT_1695639 [Mycena metata]|uniref:Uncharacterized protein n=1 Tax=Mycena metata TaxID=1033252 RepID=A0AAD7I711_9AGAR|nr:hypothetical protein B0H16DRAFT_1695639 [Mycena metata]
MPQQQKNCPRYSYPYSSTRDYVRPEYCWDSVAMVMCWGGKCVACGHELVEQAQMVITSIPFLVLDVVAGICAMGSERSRKPLIALTQWQLEAEFVAKIVPLERFAQGKSRASGDAITGSFSFSVCISSALSIYSDTARRRRWQRRLNPFYIPAVDNPRKQCKNEASWRWVSSDSGRFGAGNEMNAALWKGERR